MSKKHFDKLAACLKVERPGESYNEFTKGQWTRDVLAIASVCEEVNNRFDYNRFIEACGGLFE